jgi:Replication-relaxation
VPATTRTRPDPLRNLSHLTPRDRLLMSWLAEHHTLTTAQIATALFPSLRAAQKRLTLLYRIEALDRFAFARTATDTGGLRYTLGPLGDLLHPQPGAKRSLLARRAEVARNPMLEHLLGVNGFFTDLYGQARRSPGACLHRWWGEAQATAVYALAGIHPDGHGIWEADGRTVGFFVEHDRGTEALRVVIAKLAAYQRLAVSGPRYPVLLHLPTTERETNLHHRLADTSVTVPVATSTHATDPAGPVWALVGAIGACGARLRLHELPSDHGPEGISNPRRFEQ